MYETDSLDGMNGRMKKKRQVRKDNRRKGGKERKDSGMLGKASRGGTGWQSKRGKGNGSSNYETIAEFGLCCRLRARTGAISCFDVSGQPSMNTLCSKMEKDLIQECFATHRNHVILK
jgi:hypothetical protein